MDIKTVGVIGLAAIIVMGMLGGQGAQTTPYTSPRTISVAGEAEVRVVPDEVIITVGVETAHRDLDEAKKENDRRTAQVLAAAQAKGVEPKNIQTDYLNIRQEYVDYSKLVGLSYVVYRSMVITLRDLTRFENLLSALLKSGTTHVNNIQFRTTELRKYRDQARELAVKAAQEKAVAMAGVLGQKVGVPLTVREEQSGWYGWYGAWWGGRWAGGMTQNVIQNIDNGNTTYLGQESTLAPGQIAITARVSIDFELIK